MREGEQTNQIENQFGECLETSSSSETSFGKYDFVINNINLHECVSSSQAEPLNSVSKATKPIPPIQYEI